jgi:uncharacterized cupredoxin-like copper-binding protein
MQLRNPFAVAVTGLALAASLAACGGDDSASSAATDQPAQTQMTTATTTRAASGPIGVKASEMKFVLTADSAPAGDVTFAVDNVGGVKHEMVVVRTDKAASDLGKSNGEADESGAVGEVGADKLGPGDSATLKLNLKAGHYALICNLPGHYAAGMYKDFTVR